jgi:hypothetical protein
MGKRIVQLFAILVSALAVLGLFVSDAHLFKVMNVDLPLDIARIVLALVLIYAGFMSDNAQVARGALWLFTVVYLGLAIGGLIDSTLWGLLPTGLTGFDIAFHAGAGLIAAAVAMHMNDKHLVDAAA